MSHLESCICAPCRQERGPIFASPLPEDFPAVKWTVDENLPENTVVMLNADEVRSVSSTGGEKGTKLARYDLLPVDALRQVAEHYGKGAAKYDAHNWRRGYEWSKSYAALQRHATQFWSGEDVDEETGSHHMAAVAFHALALIEYATAHPEFDDRYSPDE